MPFLFFLFLFLLFLRLNVRFKPKNSLTFAFYKNYGMKYYYFIDFSSSLLLCKIPFEKQEENKTKNVWKKKNISMKNFKRQKMKTEKQNSEQLE